MISNYIKLAWRLLGRKKFFTFITLFGISFTLMGLMLFISYLQAELGDHDALTNRNRMMHIDQLLFEKEYYDTLVIRDTTYMDGVMKVDSTLDIKFGGTGMNQSEMSRTFLTTYIPKIKGVEHYSVISNNNDYDIFKGNQKYKIKTLFTDGSYWKIFTYTFLEGKPWDNVALDNTTQVICISEDFAYKYFGRKTDVIDQEVNVDGKNYMVVGVFKSNKNTLPFLKADGIIPYTNLSVPFTENQYFGGFSTILLANEGLDLKTIRENIHFVQDNIPIEKVDDFHDYDKLSLTNQTLDEAFARSLIYKEKGEESLKIVRWILISILLLFILLPTLNLINLNVSRIMDRSSEIGVRKAFGANQGNILTQFVFENILQSVLGGAIGLILSIVIIKILNNSKILGDIYLLVNTKFYVYSFLAAILFGIISGIIPAYKMSKLQIVNALKFKSL